MNKDELIEEIIKLCEEYKSDEIVMKYTLRSKLEELIENFINKNL